MMERSSFGRYTHAIVSRVPASFPAALGAYEPINLMEARREHQAYVSLLRDLGVDVIELPADESLPDSPFVEDTVVVANGLALMCRPGHPSRLREVDMMRSVLKRELKMPIVEMSDPNATLDGGDVLFTGKEFFVGISNRTNEPGARCLADAFPEFPVTPIKIPKKLLHLKSVMSMAGADIICISSSPDAQEILKRIEREASFKYYTLTVPDDTAANVLFINGSLVHRSEYPASNQIFQARVDYSRVSLKLWELSKPQSYLTSLAVLIRKPKSRS